MANSFSLNIKLYSFIFIIFFISSFYFYSLNSLIFSITTCIYSFSFLFALKNYIYIKRLRSIKKRYLNKIKKETKNLNEYEFKEYIENKKDIEITNEKYKNNILIDQIIYKGKFNEKSLATMIYNKKYLEK
tara:strand:- start:768 stop:1160 length:393 start_codon:yes stop_codon:yes gene_type:complete